MYRVFIFDAWMKHHIAITVERSAGSSPILTLHAPPRPDRQGSQAIAPLSVPIAIDNWYTVRRRASLFERLLVPEPEEPGVIRICTGHGPLFFVESTDPEASQDRRLRRSGLGGCQGGLAEPFAIEVALLAAEVIPACAALDAKAFYFTAERLRACAILSGDGVAAAEVYNLMRPLLADEEDRPWVDQLEAFFKGVEVAGAGIPQSARPAQFWLQALTGDRSYFLVERVHARNASHVLVEGVLRTRLPRTQGRDQERTQEAPVQLEWEDALSGLKIKRLTIGETQEAPDLCNSRDYRSRAVDC